MPEKDLLFPPQNDIEALAAVEVDKAKAVNDIGKVILFRVMNLDNHSGVTHRSEDGTIHYTVDNQQYPDQGDFAFGNAESGFQDATNRAFPNYLHNVHAVQVEADQIVEPYPDQAPGLMYIKNGTNAVAKRVPAEIIDQYVEDPNAAPSDLTRQVKEKLFSTERDMSK